MSAQVSFSFVSSLTYADVLVCSTVSAGSGIKEVSLLTAV